MIATSLLPPWLAVMLAVASGVGTVVGIISTILNIDLAWARVRAGAGRVKAGAGVARAKLRRGP